MTVVPDLRTSEPAAFPGSGPDDAPAPDPIGVLHSVATGAQAGGPVGSAVPIPPVPAVTLRAIRVRSLARVSTAVAGITLAAIVVGSVLAWWAATLTGQVGSLESAFAEALGVDAVALPGGRILVAVTILAAVTLAFAVGLVVLGAAIYNRVASSLGGIEVEVAAGVGLARNRA